jgi:hypothetical protein
VADRLALDKKYGYTVASDGYTDITRRYLINFVINTTSGGFFEATVEMGLEEKNADAIAKLFDPIFEKYGRDIIAVVTDSAAVMKSAGKLIEGRYSWVAWLPCVTHQADLMMKKIAKLDYFREMVSQVWCLKSAKSIVFYHALLCFAL